MAIVSKYRLARDERGAAIAEFTVVSGVLFVVLFGIVEFSHLFQQWNAATKAVQVGARIAATSEPVWENAVDLTGFEGGNPSSPRLAGEDIAYTYKVVCQLGSCSKTGSIPNNTQTDYSSANMSNLVFGRGSTQCGDAITTYPGMCDIFRRIGVNNVRVTYEHSGLGYIGRPGGLVPTITLEVFDLPFQFIFLDSIMALFGEANLRQTTIPGLKTTISAEDMRSGAPTF